MISIKRIMSTLQGGVDVELGMKTLLVGKNGSGKSRIRRSIELALTGRATDVAGRDEVAKTIELLSLATPGSDLETRAFLSDSTEASFAIRRVVKGKKGSEKVSSSAAVESIPPSVQREKVLPLWALYEAILGKPETARKFFLSFTVRDIVRADVLGRLPASLHARYEQAIQSSGIQVNQPEINKLLAVLELASKKSGESTREANAAMKMVNESSGGLPTPPTDADYTAAKGAVDAARTALETSVKGYQHQSQLADLQARLLELAGKSATAVSNRRQAEDQLQLILGESDKLPALDSVAVPSALSQGQKAVIEAVLWHAEQEEQIEQGADLAGADTGSSSCACCGSRVRFGTFAERERVARADLARNDAAFKQAHDYYEWLKKAHLRKEELLAGAQFEIEQANQQIEVHAAAYKQVEELMLKARGSLNGEDAGNLTIENARLALSGAEERMRGLDAARAAWESTKKLRDGAVLAESEGNVWHQLTKACDAVVRDLLDLGVENFCSRVQTYLPPNDVFKLRLRDGSREVCQFGLEKGGQLYTALSGAEWARVTAAMASVCATGANDRLEVVCPEERAFDAETLTQVLFAFSKMPQQVIIESPIRPSLMPEGWTVIQTDRMEKPAKPVEPRVRREPKAENGKEQVPPPPPLPPLSFTE